MNPTRRKRAANLLAISSRPVSASGMFLIWTAVRNRSRTVSVATRSMFTHVTGRHATTVSVLRVISRSAIRPPATCSISSAVRHSASGA